MNLTSRASKRGRSFSLTELLVVVAILVVLMSLLAPSLRRSYLLAAQTACQSNLKQIGVGYGVMAEDMNGIYPDLSVQNGRSPSMDISKSVLGLSYIDRRRQMGGGLFEFQVNRYKLKTEESFRGTVFSLLAYYGFTFEALDCSDLPAQKYDLGVSLDILNNHSKVYGGVTGFWGRPMRNAHSGKEYDVKGAWNQLFAKIQSGEIRDDQATDTKSTYNSHTYTPRLLNEYKSVNFQVWKYNIGYYLYGGGDDPLLPSGVDSHPEGLLAADVHAVRHHKETRDSNRSTMLNAFVRIPHENLNLLYNDGSLKQLPIRSGEMLYQHYFNQYGSSNGTTYVEDVEGKKAIFKNGAESNSIDSVLLYHSQDS